MKKLTLCFLLSVMTAGGMYAQRIQQPLGRGVVAVTDNARQDVLVTWRKLAQEPDGCTYNLYKRSNGGGYTKVNTEPITKTNYQTTRSVIPYDTELAVTYVKDGVESKMSNPFLFKKQAYKDVFFDFNFETKVLNPNDYKAKYVWPMDLDGNGEFDAVLVDRLYAGAVEIDPDAGGSGTGGGMTGTSHKLQAYKLDGTCLWTIDMGPNVDICAGQNDMVVAYDINCDGKCEVIIKTSDGTRFWDAANNTWGKYAMGSSVADTDGDGIVDYRGDGTVGQTKRNPPFYVSVVDAATGAEIECSELKYSEVTDGVDSYGRDNRKDYMDDNYGTEYAFMCGHFGICYFDGVHPSLVMKCLNRTKSDRSHHDYVFVWSYDWNQGRPANWHHSYTWSRNDKTPWPAEFHSMRVADVDGDGIDDMIQGGYAVNPVKGMVYSAGIGHGDRFRVSDIDPERPGMEVFAIQQSNLLGQILYDAATGKPIKEWYLPTVTDVARGECMDVDPDHKGYEIFSTMQNLYDCHGDVIKSGDTPFPTEGIWWDGNLQREMLSSPGGSGYGTNAMVQTYGGTRLYEFSKASEWAVHTGWAIRPAFFGDITGDWREEVILMKQNADTSTGLVGYSTDIPTDYSIYTLQEDPHYRLDCTTRGYYQSPNTSFYLGGDMPAPPVPPVMVADLRWSNGASWTAGGGGFTSYDQTSAQGYADGKSVIFDISGECGRPIEITGNIAPKAVYIMNPAGHDYTFGGQGVLTCDMELVKSMLGTATINNNLVSTGNVVISEGTLVLNGTVDAPIGLRAKGTLAGTGTVNGSMTFEGALNYQGCRIMPGTDADIYGTLIFGQSLVIPGNVYIEVNAAGGKASHIKVNGDLTFAGDNTFTVDSREEKLMAGRYLLAECTGKLTAEPADILTIGLEGYDFDITVENGNSLVLTVNATRAPQKDVAWTGNESGLWDYKAKNFVAGGNSTAFVSGDEVVFGDEASVRDITVDNLVKTKGVTFDFDNGVYTLSGDGGISGEGALTKNGRGELKINLRGSDYTGATVINEGTVTVSDLSDGGVAGPLGAASSDEGFFRMNGGTLKVTADNVSTNHIVTLTDTSAVNVTNAKGSVSFKNIVKGSGYLVKDGPGQLNFNYAGESPFAGMIIKKGIVAQGDWRATFGRKGSPMVLAGGEVNLIDMNNSSTRPIFDYSVTVEEGTSSVIKGTTRGAVNGTFKGKGRLTIVSTGVRSDVGGNFSAFEGTLVANGGNFRLMDNVTDMRKTTFELDPGAVVGHYASNGSSAKGVTTKIGALQSTATDCKLGNGSDTYEVGYNNENTTYSGLLTAKNIYKYGKGVLTLKGNGSTSPVTVAEGTLQLSNSALASNAFSSGTVVVREGAVLTGNGCASRVNCMKGGVVAAGLNGGYGTFKATSTVSMREGSTLIVKVGKSSSGSAANDKFKFDGATTHSGDTILIRVSADRVLTEGETVTVFTGSGANNGTYVLKTECGTHTVEWDDSRLLSDGVLTVKALTGIKGIVADDTLVDVYSVDGIKIRGNVRNDEALDGLGSGVYIINGEKVIKK
ncbi:cellulosome protein [Xylanibacter muris]|uniref:Cellulosome protein n=1 Tax=Xylanibacter muris TaxID=2736290 RepID=A0ABX2APA4_9BACT|nr:cellulosome protein [Xylanibacter muris]NPD92005.1 cellulosome protein [Xylanibacter muris]